MKITGEVVSFFHRHVVPVFFTFRKGNETQSFMLTSFVLSVSEQWFLVTAGHCIRGIDELVKYGYEISNCLLIDSLGLGAEYPDPIPFVFNKSNPKFLSDDYAFDYGIMNLSPYYRQLLERNNVQALDEEVWKKQPSEVDFYMLIGIPAELLIVDPGHIQIEPTLIYIEPIDYVPEGFIEVDASLFYGRISLDHNLKSIKGMSGGPIFSFHQYENGELRYWLTALQSRWLPESHYIAACPTSLLGHFLEDVIVGKKK